MMDKELPNSQTSGSAFTVFGFGGSRYTDVFDSPLDDNAPESFNAEKFLAYPRRPRKKQRGKVSAPAYSATDDARKLRLGGPDNSHLVLQSMGSSGAASTTLTPLLDAAQTTAAVSSSLAEGHLARRYSETQSVAGSEAVWRLQDGTKISTTQQHPQQSSGVIDTTTHTDQFLQMISSTFGSPAVQQDRLHRTSSLHSRRSTAFNKSRDSEDTSKLASSKRGTLKRQDSSPALASLPSYRNANQISAGVPDPAETTSNSSSSSLGSGIVKGQIMHRVASAGVLSSLVGAGTSDNSRNCEDKALATSSQAPSLPSSSHVDQHAGAIVQSTGGAGSAPSATSGLDSTDSTGGASTSAGFGGGMLARTRQFGAWLGQVTKGERIEVTKKDLNVFAPTSF